MKPKNSNSKRSADKVIKDIRRKTRRHFSAEDKIRIVMEGLRCDDSIAELRRQEGIAQSLYYTLATTPHRKSKAAPSAMIFIPSAR